MPPIAVDDESHRLKAVELSALEAEVLNGLYPELNRIASHQINREATGNLWSPSDLIHEAYLRLIHAYGKEWVNMPTPLILWRRVMIRVLIDHSRASRAQKRWWGTQEPLDQDLRVGVSPKIEICIAVRTAVQQVHRLDRRIGAAIHLTAIAGYTIEETASALKVNSRTVKRLLHSGRCELRQQLQTREVRCQLRVAA